MVVLSLHVDVSEVHLTFSFFTFQFINGFNSANVFNTLSIIVGCNEGVNYT
jgi:hypothetical protein